MNMASNQQAPTQGEIDNIFHSIQQGLLGQNAGNFGVGGSYL